MRRVPAIRRSSSGTRRSGRSSRSGSRSSSGSSNISWERIFGTPPNRRTPSGSRRSSANSSRISSDSDIEERMSEIYDYLTETYSERFFELGHEPPGMIRFIENLGLTQDEMDLLHQMVDDGWR